MTAAMMFDVITFFNGPIENLLLTKSNMNAKLCHSDDVQNKQRKKKYRIAYLHTYSHGK